MVYDNLQNNSPLTKNTSLSIVKGKADKSKNQNKISKSISNLIFDVEKTVKNASKYYNTIREEKVKNLKDK